MFKLLTLALISLVGMDYANTSGNNIQRAATVDIVEGGTLYDDINSGFFLPTAYGDFIYDGPLVPTATHYTYYNYYFTFYADYVYFKTYTNGQENMIDMRDMEYYDDIQFYTMQVYLNHDNDRFIWFFNTYDFEGERISSFTISSFSADASQDLNGLEVFYNNIAHQCFYVSNFRFRSWFQHNFTGYNGDTFETFTVNTSIHNVPLVVDNRFRSLERYYYFPSQPVVYGYWYKDQNSTYYIDTLNTVGTISRPVIFKGYFKSNGKNYKTYMFDGYNTEQGSPGWYFGPYQQVTSVSNTVHPNPGTQFWFANMGLYQFFDDFHFDVVWHVLTTPLILSSTEHQVISNTYEWYTFLYQTLYLVYEEVDTSGNLTSVENMSYYDMLTFNTGYISTPTTDINAFTNALQLLGIAFNQLWAVGNIVIFGSITINSLIILPLLVSLVIFIIHLIKKG